MNCKTCNKYVKRLALGLAALALATAPSFAAELAAVEATATMPDANAVAMWGFIDLEALTPPTTAADFVCGTVNPADSWAVGPTLTATAGAPLTVKIKNCLADPVSVFIPGQLKQTVPVTFQDTAVPPRTRVRSFDVETAPNATGVYEWTGVKEGTYLYHSGTHPQVQVQMGLYGALVVSGLEYPAVAQEAVLVYSEIDPALHAAVADLSYGTPAYPSTFDYMPRYFLINGAPSEPDMNVNSGEDVLLRFVNAGLRTHVPTLEGGLYMSLIAEDGNLYPSEMLPIEQYGIELQAAKTIDAIVNVGSDGRYALYDRASGPGGMLTYLNASEGAGMFVLDAATYSVAENDAGGILTVTVDRVGGSAGVASVNWATDDGSATDVTDYTAASGTLTFFDGIKDPQQFSIAFLDDTVYEGDETFSVSLNTPTGGANLGAPASAVVTITENEPQPPTLQFSAAAYGVAENGGTITVTVDRVGASAGAVSVDYTTVDGTATAGSDYTGTVGPVTLTILAGEITQDFAIAILGDPDFEGDETFSVALSNPTNLTGDAILGVPANAVVTINDDDAANIAPIANDDTLSTPRARGGDPQTRVIASPLIVANDEDPDCGEGSPCIDMESVVITTGSSTSRGGTVVYNPAEGTVTYTPKNKGFRGTDTFQYTVEDDPNGIPGDHDGATSNVATVRINVVNWKSTVSSKAAKQ